jgi:hypothetical protein
MHRPSSYQACPICSAVEFVPTALPSMKVGSEWNALPLQCEGEGRTSGLPPRTASSQDDARRHYLLTWIEGIRAVLETVKLSHIPLFRCPGTRQTT